MSRHDGEAQGADLVGGIAVGNHPVRAGDDQSDLPLGHQGCRHVVADQGDFQAGLQQLPGGQARALQQGAGFIHKHPEVHAAPVGEIHGGGGGAQAGRGEGAGVAMGEHARAFLDQRLARIADASAQLPVFIMDANGLRQ